MDSSLLVVAALVLMSRALELNSTSQWRKILNVFVDNIVMMTAIKKRDINFKV